MPSCTCPRTEQGKRRFGYLLFSLLCVLRGGDVALAQFQMPDPKEMSGIPRPVTDLPNGSLSVRLIRGELSNNIVNHPVELHAGSKVTTVNTDENGRAQFDALAPGTSVKAVAVVDGERLESQEFPMPAGGGIRVMLVATDPSKRQATTPDAPPISGQVVIGTQSRIVIQPIDDMVDVFYLLDIENTARAPVNPPTPFYFDLPRGTRGSIMDGSSPKAIIKGRRVSVQGPFPPGHTFVQVSYAVSGDGGSFDASQTFPANFQQLAVVVKKVGATAFSSTRTSTQREMQAEGETYIAAIGGAVPAGQAIDLSVSGFPHHSTAPRVIALLLAVGIVAVGMSAGRPTTDEPDAGAERKRLIARREKLFADLVRLEHDRRSGRTDESRYASRRESLVSALEQVYGALDRDDSVAA
jgi:hypothetical protein